MTLDVEQVLGPGGLISQRLSDYQERPQQIEMARAVAAAIANGEHLLTEAGTGVGKSFAYLLPAILHVAQRSGAGPIVVSTRTIALQEQLDRKDLPFLQQILPLEWSAVTAIGRNNYLCLRRMHMAHGAGQSMFDRREHDEQLASIVQWSLTTHSGTRMALPTPVSNEVWEEVRAEHGNCLNRACPHFEPCHWQRARRRMDGAQVLVVNHSLYMADLALRMAGTRYLPDHRVVVFDEAHHLERVATESLGLRLTEHSIQWHLRRLLGQRGEGLLMRCQASHLGSLCGDVKAANDVFFAQLEQRLTKSREGMFALGEDCLDDPLSRPLMTLIEALHEFALTVEKVDLRSELQSRVKQLSNLHATILRLCQPGGANLVRWIESDRHGPAVHCAPLDVSATLAEHLFAQRTAILTSATLGPTGDTDFAWLRGQLGIERAKTLRLGSPFDFAKQMVIEVEEAMPDPSRDSEQFLRESTLRIERLILAEPGRALVLCTSWHVVRSLAQALRTPLANAGLRLLVQGEAPLANLLEDKRRDPNTVLIGTDSLWEGIDVPGEALTLVIVTKFPFQQPGHPLVEARLRAIEARGGNGFQDHTLPEAIIKFRQGIGRLIRSHTDHGRIVILDPRMRTKAYGRQFWAALPHRG